ncbi:bifunctional diguanylate cyclase/phosphodiesterase [Desulfuromonas versatilis]|nr:EAL domain-containing protein [Desulfuromonas versatilis]
MILIPLVALPLLAVGWLAYVQLQDTSEGKTRVEMDTKLSQLSRQLETIRQTALANLELFSEAALLTQYLQTGDDLERYSLVQPPLLRLFASYQRAYPQYQEIRVLLPDGYEDARMAVPGVPNRTEEENQTPFFISLAAGQEKVHSAFLENPDTGKISLYASKQIELVDWVKESVTAPPRLRGYLSLTVDLSTVEKQLAANRIGQSGALFAVDPSGTILFHPDPGRIGSTLSGPLLAQLTPLARQQGFATLGLEGGPCLVGGRMLDEELLLFAMLPHAELLGASHRLGLNIALITLAAVLVTFGLHLSGIRALLVRPIQKLGKAAQEIGKGNLELSIDISTRDEIGQLAATFQEMSRNLAESHQRIQFLAYHDPLTGLPNRRMFQELLNYSLAHARRAGHQMALLFLDLDNFKRVNDTLGHHAGDRLLEELATRLSGCLRKEDTLALDSESDCRQTVARLGGDEFTILLPNLKNPFAAASVAKRVLEALSPPFCIDSHEVFTSASIGITIFPGDGEDAATLVKHADIAMYHAKQQGKNNYQYYAASMNAAALERLNLENQLRRALSRGELQLYYQPLVDAATLNTVSAEALMRWRHPELGMISPAQFIPIAEESGLIVAMGAWAVKEACRQLRHWQHLGLRPVPVAVNLSSLQFRHQKIDELVATTLQETGLDPSLLQVELTESAIMQAEEPSVQMLVNLKELGVGIAIDDFGTGYSSLSYLRRFPIDTLKIDRSFIKDILQDADDATITRAIISMAHSLELTVTAEGVETEGQLEFLRDNGCDKIQGYLVSAPVPAAEFVRFMQSPRGENHSAAREASF